jgi:hypothetical protein
MSIILSIIIIKLVLSLLYKYVPFVKTFRFIVIQFVRYVILDNRSVIIKSQLSGKITSI